MFRSRSSCVLIAFFNASRVLLIALTSPLKPLIVLTTSKGAGTEIQRNSIQSHHSFFFFRRLSRNYIPDTLIAFLVHSLSPLMSAPQFGQKFHMIFCSGCSCSHWSQYISPSCSIVLVRIHFPFFRSGCADGKAFIAFTVS